MIAEPRLFVTGTDTDVGKTYVTSALATTLRFQLAPATPITIVKPVQTGLAEGKPGDARQAFAGAKGAQIFARELRRFHNAADPYSAARAEGQEPPRADELAREIAEIQGALVVEGAGGAACPLNEHETMIDLAAAAKLSVVVVVGLRLGCISHALMTAEYVKSKGCKLLGAVLVDRFEKSSVDYVADVERALVRAMPIIATLEHDPAQKPASAVSRLSSFLFN